MSNSSETDLNLDLEFLPAWAQQTADPNRYAKYAGETAPDNRRQEPWGRRPRPRERSGPGDRPGPQPRRNDRDRGQGRRPDDRRRSDRDPRRESVAPLALPDLNVAFKPDDIGVESLARQIRMTGRAYPLFSIAQMVLQKPERQFLTLSVKKKPDGQPAQPLFVCALDETPWLSEDEAVNYALDKHFATFYQPERTQIDPPKGIYTFVAQCGLSGAILGPPNHHDYQNQLHKLHAERFSRMPFESFKSRVKIVKDEAVVKKWIEDQSWKTEYICLNLPDALKLGSRAEVEAHFRTTHLPNIIRQVETFTLGGTAARNLRCAGMARLVRHAWEEQKRFPLQIATVLSQQFASHGLQFFKVNRAVTHVAVARPHYLDLDAAPVSEGVKRIVQYINANPKSTRRKLIEALAPSPAPAPGAPAATPPKAAEPSPEATAISSDLHWLIHQGHVIEFANGMLETAKKPLPKPPPKTPAAPATDLAVKETPPEGVVGESAPGEPVAAEPSAAAEEPSIGEPPPVSAELAQEKPAAEAAAQSDPPETSFSASAEPAPEPGSETNTGDLGKRT